MNEDKPNQKPSVTISSPQNGSEYARTDTIVFEGSAEDPETGALTGANLKWESSTDGSIGEGEKIATPTLSPDVHTVTLAATDSAGKTARDTVSVSVNGPPTVNVTAPDNKSAANKGETVTFESSASDPVNGELSGDALEWSSDADGTLGTGKSVSTSSLSPGPHTITLTATDQDGTVASDSIEFVVEEEGFNVRFRFLSDLTTSQKKTIRNAAVPWTNAITDDLAPFFLGAGLANQTGLSEGGIDDLAMSVRIRNVDGDGGVLAAAAPRAARRDDAGNFTTSIAGIIRIDEADLDNPRLERIVTHEIGHVLGIGTTWSAVSDVNTVDPVHEGPSTTATFDALEGSKAYLGEGVPLERFGGRGTALGHWAENNFDNELMTGFINANSENPLSRVSLAALKDLGYGVNLQDAESYTLPTAQRTLFPAEADATLSRPASADENFGTPQGGQLDSVLVAGSNNGQLWSSEDPEDEVFSSLVRFSTPSSLPMGVSVTGAGIALQSANSNAETTGHDVGIYLVGKSWSETNVTANNRPPRKDSITAFDFQSCGSSFCGQDGAPDVTAPVKNWVTGGENNGFLLRAPDAASDPTFSVGFHNRHVRRSAVLRPFLVVFAQTSSGSSVRTDKLLGPNGLSSGRSTSSGKIPLGDDILEGPVYGMDPEGNVEMIKRIR